MKRSSKRRRQPGKLTTAEIMAFDPEGAADLRKRLWLRIRNIRDRHNPSYTWTRGIKPHHRYISTHNKTLVL